MKKDKNSENVPYLKITEVVLVHCNTVNNDYQRSSRVFYTFVPSKSLIITLDISLKDFVSLKTFNSDFSNKSMIY